MELEFIPVEEFYFALTLAVKILEEIEQPELPARVKLQLEQRFGQPSTVAAARHNTFNYVFRVCRWEGAPAAQLIVSISDWQEKLRLSSNYGWTLDENRRPVRTQQYQHRQLFAQQLRSHLQNWLQVNLTGNNSF